MADKDTKKAIRADIKASCIPEEMKMMYLLAGATQCVVENVMNRLRSIYRAKGFILKDNEMLSGLNDFCKCIKQADYHFFNRIDNHVINCTWGMGRNEDNPDAPGNTEAYDGFTEDQLEVVRLLVLYIDRTAQNNEAFAKVFKTLRCMPSGGVFKDEDVAMFKLKKLK